MLRQERRIVRPANPEQWPRVTQIKAKRFPPRCCHHHHVLRVDAIFCPPGSVTVSPENWFFVAHVVVPQISRVDISTQRALPRKIILFAQFLKSSSRPDVPASSMHRDVHGAKKKLNLTSFFAFKVARKSHVTAVSTNPESSCQSGPKAANGRPAGRHNAGKVQSLAGIVVPCTVQW